MQAPDLPLVHVVAGMVTANRNRAPVILIASQIIRDELGFRFHSGGRLQAGLQEPI
jgi:thiamine pyrophosphate-dependent acetolactate synthase large subunit-like protein